MDSPRTASRCALVVGASGQDGYYLCRELEARGDRVIRVTRNGVVGDRARQPLDILDAAAVRRLVGETAPDEIYYLAAYHHSSQQDAGSLRALIEKSHDIHCTGLLNFLDAMTVVRRQARLFYAASSLVFGDPRRVPQDEDTPMAPVCAYGITKLLGMGLCRAYRSNEGLFACAGILYNHESPRRAPHFVTRKIARAVADIKRGQAKPLEMGALDARVDWSAVEDVVAAMTAMLAMDSPQDLVIASGVLHSVRDFAAHAFGVAGLDYRQHVVEKPELLHRSPRKQPLCGDTRRLRAATGWQAKVSFEELVERMVRAELDTRVQ
jgi:GDPmannose 4,6-dehydratase